MAAIYSNGGNRWNILGFNFTKRDALSSVYNISMVQSLYSKKREAASHMMVLMVADEKRNFKPYALPVEFLNISQCY